VLVLVPFVAVLVALPAAAAPLGAAAPARGAASASLLKLIRKTFPRDAARAVCVARHESSLRPRAYSRGNYGLFQINWSAHSYLDRSRLFQPVYNVRAARRIYDDARRRWGNGWIPWAVRGMCGA
jgi:soluble lytic murein transglycosylase-like protein